MSGNDNHSKDNNDFQALVFARGRFPGDRRPESTRYNLQGLSCPDADFDHVEVMPFLSHFSTGS